jgi:hypothetical protein
MSIVLFETSDVDVSIADITDTKRNPRENVTIERAAGNVPT